MTELAKSFHTRGSRDLQELEDREADAQISAFFESTGAQKAVRGGRTSVTLRPGEISPISKSTVPTVHQYEDINTETNENIGDIPRRTEFSDGEIDEIINRVLNLTKRSAA